MPEATEVNEYTATITLTEPVTERDHIAGPDNAPATLVVYGDYQCEDTGAAHRIICEVRERLGDKMRLVFRNYPITKTHEYAEEAAEAAEAAGGQGKFWEMHDFLFHHQDALDHNSLMEYAEEIGLDLEQFEKDLDRRTYAPRIIEDIVSGKHSGVDQTPTLFINGVRHDGVLDADSLEKAIELAAESF